MDTRNNGDDAGMDPAAMQTLYARTLYRMRESRKALLRRCCVSDEAVLLEKIRSGEVPEHPAYEHYLSARILDQGRQQLREEVLVQLGSKSESEVAAISVHLLLKEQLEEMYASRFAEPLRLAQDAILMSFDTGLMLEVRFFSSDEFSVHWTWGKAELRMDTAPVHTTLASFPRHVHRHDGRVTEDPVGVYDADPWISLARLLDVLLVDPLLERG
jgi:hypothetical protein